MELWNRTVVTLDSNSSEIYVTTRLDLELFKRENISLTETLKQAKVSDVRNGYHSTVVIIQGVGRS